MGLYLKNKTNELLWVVYGYSAPGCEGGVDWAKKGWWAIAPGQTKKVRSGWVGGWYWLFYAEADDFSPVWAGPYFTHIPWSAFDWCWTTASTSGRTLGLRAFYAPWYAMDYTIGLVK
jgi:uncharacterized membrane protein